MPLRIRQNPISSGSATFTPRPDEVRGHLMIIAMAGTEDIPGDFGEEPDPGDADFTRIVWDPGPQDLSTERGRVRDTLKRLIDRSANTDIRGVGEDFIWADGRDIEDRPAQTLGSEVTYEVTSCRGDGRWVIAEDGSQDCTPAAVILLHELRHVILNIADPLHPEGDAIDGENDMRVLLGLKRRSTSDISGGCGCPADCCIVASVASGSPFSQQVVALRRLRDQTLRSTRLGEAFFEALHREYYRFSVPIARMLVTDEAARHHVERWLVAPLVKMLELGRLATERPGDSLALGQAFLDEFRSLGWLSPHEARQTRTLLKDVGQGQIKDPLPGDLDFLLPVCSTLAEHLPRAPHVRWAIWTPLEIASETLTHFQADVSPGILGAWLSDRLHQWLGEIPLEHLETSLSAHQLAGDFKLLGDSVFSSPLSRHKLATRLSRRDNTREVLRRLRKEGFFRG